MQNSNDFDGFVKEMYQFMKKYFAILLACCLCLTAAFPAFAAETDTEELFEFLTEENPDYEEVTALEDEILQKLEDHLSSNGANLPDGLTPDYTQAYKVYTDTPILTMDTLNESDLRAALEEGTYFWVIPFPDIEGKSYNIPVCYADDEWSVPYSEECDSAAELSYVSPAEERIQELPEGTYTAVLVGGLRFFSQPVAVVFQDGNAVYLVQSKTPLGLEGTEEQQEQLAAEGFSVSDGIYQYDKVAQTVKNAPPADSEKIGGDVLNAAYLNPDSGVSPLWIFIAAVAVVVLVVILAVVFKRRRTA